MSNAFRSETALSYYRAKYKYLALVIKARFWTVQPLAVLGNGGSAGTTPLDHVVPVVGIDAGSRIGRLEILLIPRCNYQ